MQDRIRHLFALAKCQHIRVYPGCFGLHTFESLLEMWEGLSEQPGVRKWLEHRIEDAIAALNAARRRPPPPPAGGWLMD